MEGEKARLSLIPPERDPCPFCSNIQGTNRCAFVYRANGISSFVNPRQYERGGLLIIPDRHAATILELDQETMAELYVHVQHVARAVCRALQPIGLNIFQNNGSAAGQSVPHVHIHIVPRYHDKEPAKVYSEKHVNKTPFEERVTLARIIKEYL
ncbi:MAG: HIT family protein [Chloroflexota bacterium]